ncbi:hypothetical protein HJG60_008775 [Phyllostomus discolor]|uniref:Uncharacterized protein n=1 Tax=Phyllostomus discolor TaxID=89673 RepID=A0A834DI47_9CHIR|nr:hypothetical protein HJG60_008775 [Phyllostomus discolor]
MPGTPCFGPLQQLFPLSQIILSPDLCVARFFLSLRSRLRPSTVPLSCDLRSLTLIMPILILGLVFTTLLHFLGFGCLCLFHFGFSPKREAKTRMWMPMACLEDVARGGGEDAEQVRQGRVQSQ